MLLCIINLSELCLPDNKVDKTRPVQIQDRLAILQIMEGCNQRVARMEVATIDDIPGMVKNLFDALETTINDWINEDTPFASYICCLELAFYRRLLRYHNENTTNLTPYLENEFWYMYSMQLINRLTESLYAYYFYTNLGTNKTVSFETSKQPTITGGRIKQKTTKGTGNWEGTKVANGAGGDFPGFGGGTEEDDTPSTIENINTTLFRDAPSPEQGDAPSPGGGDYPSHDGSVLSSMN